MKVLVEIVAVSVTDSNNKLIIEQHGEWIKEHDDVQGLLESLAPERGSITAINRISGHVHIHTVDAEVTQKSFR